MSTSAIQGHRPPILAVAAPARALPGRSDLADPDAAGSRQRPANVELDPPLTPENRDRADASSVRWPDPNSDRAPGPATGLAAGALLCTPAGPILIEDLRPGDVVQTPKGARRMIRAITQVELGLASYEGHVLIRAPYFGLSHDLVARPGQLIGLSGAAIDYVLGQPTALARAGDLVNGVSVIRDLRGEPRDFFDLTLDDADCVMVGACHLGVGNPRHTMIIDRPAAQAILPFLQDSAITSL